MPFPGCSTIDRSISGERQIVRLVAFEEARIREVVTFAIASAPAMRGSRSASIWDGVAILVRDVTWGGGRDLARWETIGRRSARTFVRRHCARGASPAGMSQLGLPLRGGRLMEGPVGRSQSRPCILKEWNCSDRLVELRA